MAAHASGQVEVIKCPACKNPIIANMTYGMTLNDERFANEVVTASVHPVGVTIRHECKDGRIVPTARSTPGWVSP